MSALTTTLAIQVPDSDDDLRKMLSLLRAAESKVNDYAQDEIGRCDDAMRLLENALEPPHPQTYRAKITAIYTDMMAWNEARHQCQRIIMTGFIALQKELVERRERKG